MTNILTSLFTFPPTLRGRLTSWIWRRPGWIWSSHGRSCPRRRLSRRAVLRFAPVKARHCRVLVPRPIYILERISIFVYFGKPFLSFLLPRVGNRLALLFVVRAFRAFPQGFGGSDYRSFPAFEGGYSSGGDGCCFQDDHFVFLLGQNSTPDPWPTPGLSNVRRAETVKRMDGLECVCDVDEKNRKCFCSYFL